MICNETIEVRGGGGRVSIRIRDTRFVRLMNLISIVNALQTTEPTGRRRGKEERRGGEGSGESNETLNGRPADGGSLLSPSVRSRRIY